MESGVARVFLAKSPRRTVHHVLTVPLPSLAQMALCVCYVMLVLNPLCLAQGASLVFAVTALLEASVSCVNLALHQTQL